MREVKFRAWDKKRAVMAGVETIYRDGIEVRNNEGKGRFLETDYELMQFIGLRDKNGKEIFESDLLQVGEEIFEVFWDNENLKWATKETCNKFNVGEIVGNIYEKPEETGV